MKLNGLRALLPALIFFLAALAASVWIWLASSGHASSVRAQKEKLALSNLAAHDRLLRSGAEKTQLLAHLSVYRQLEQRGATGGGDRLAWLDAVQQANQATGLYGLQYTLEPAEPVPGNHAMDRTTMKLRMPLLTEPDLERFFHALAQRNTGPYAVKTCILSRTGSLPPVPLNQPGLDAECTLHWYSVRKAATS